MRRKFFNLAGVAAMLSVVICLATVVMWIRGRWVVDVLEYNGTPTRSGQMNHAVFLGKTGVCIASMNNPMGYGAAPVGFRYYGDPQRIEEFYPDGRSSLGGFAFVADRFVVPYWAIALLTATMPLALLLAPRRRSRALNHLCASCGYDMRATPERCPECGEVPPTPPHNPPMYRTGPAV